MRAALSETVYRLCTSLSTKCVDKFYQGLRYCRLLRRKTLSLPNCGAQAKVSRHFFIRGPRVFAIIQAAGWPIWPLLIASIIAVALIIERLVMLRESKIV